MLSTLLFREIYYSYPEFTQTQYAIDDAVKDVCLILNARPWEIGILSSSKGLIAGSIKLTLNDDSIINVENMDEGWYIFQSPFKIFVFSFVQKYRLCRDFRIHSHVFVPF